jgi:hypothetical protein
MQAMHEYLVHVGTVVPGVELRLKISITGVVTVNSDRGGEFTTAWGFTQSVFDELLEQRGIRRRLNSPDTPKSGTTPAGWGSFGDIPRYAGGEAVPDT